MLVKMPTSAAVVLLFLTLPSVHIAAESPAAEPQPRRILFDTDPGGDDIFALLWLQSLARQGHAEIVAVTTVGGNVSSRQTFENASRVLALGGHASVEVARCATADRPAADASHIHGLDGMGNLAQQLPAAPHRWDDAPRADDVIIRRLEQSPGQITLVAVGPLTNLAAAERKRPGILKRAREVVVMGGAFTRRGNVTPHAEFNIYCDPAAAQRVFDSRDDIVVLPLDVTTRVNFRPEHAAEVLRGAPTSATANFLADLTQFLTHTTLGFREADGLACFHVHDAATLAYLYHPELLLLRRAHVRVETEGRWTTGQTVFDQRHGAKRQANAWVAQQVDATNLLSILVEDFKLLSR
jgi:inosine-uridine nucleoside N-ribohydrolase